MPMILGGSGTITSDKITIDANGNAGIGTSSPSVKSHIANGDMILSSSTGSSVFQIRDESDSGRGLMFKSNHSGTSNTYIGTNSSIKNIIFGIDGIERMRLDTSGYVTTPYHPHLKATITGAVGTVSLTSSPLTIPYNSISSQIGSNYNNSNYRFTAPITGRYFVHAGLQASGTNTTYSNLLATVNGNATSGTYKNMTGAGYQRMEVTDIVNISAGDYISIIYVASATSGTIEAAGDFRNSLTIYFLG